MQSEHVVFLYMNASWIADSSRKQKTQTTQKPWITLNIYQPLKGINGGSFSSITVRFKHNVSVCCCTMLHAYKNSGLAGWVVWLYGVCVKVHTPHAVGSMFVYVSVTTVCTFMYICTVCGCVSHPSRALVSRVRGGQGHRAAVSLGRTGALEHAGVEACVSPGVFSQVVAPHEALVTHWTVEPLFTRVCAVVTRQLVWTGELLATVRPGTLEGPLTWGNTRTPLVTAVLRTLLWLTLVVWGAIHPTAVCVKQ